MAKILISWEHAEERNLQRVKPEHRMRVQQILDLMITMEAPGEALGHYPWYIEIYGQSNDVVARLIIRGVAVRTVYGPDMRPPMGATKFRIDKKLNKFIKAGN